MTMEINEKLKDTKYVAAATINADSGIINNGDNSNALAIADAQYGDTISFDPDLPNDLRESLSPQTSRS